jgi:hypothetical protein
MVERNEVTDEQEDEYEKRYFRYFQDDDGMWLFNGKLPMIEGGLVVKLLKELVRQKFHELYSTKKASAEALDLEDKEAEETNSEKTTDLTENDSAAAPNDSIKTILDGPDIIEKPHTGQICADMLSNIAEHYIATAQGRAGKKSEYLERLVPARWNQGLVTGLSRRDAISRTNLIKCNYSSLKLGPCRSS